MPSENDKRSNHIPIRFVDDESVATQSALDSEFDRTDAMPEDDSASDHDGEEMDAAGAQCAADHLENGEDLEEDDLTNAQNDLRLNDDEAENGYGLEPEAIYNAANSPDLSSAVAGPALAELVATRAELRRIEGELQRAETEMGSAATERQDLLDKVMRLQADFGNYRKRVERERSDTYHRTVGEVVAKLLPVVDNFHRALDAQTSAGAVESEEFRHFVQGIQLIEKQLSDILQSYGVEPVETIGHQFNPHIHEAIATEESDRFEPETVTEEIVRGYRLGDKLLRPAMVKVAK